MNTKDHSQMFIIESGKPLEMIKRHIAERIRVRTEASNLCKELGVEQMWNDRMTGILTMVTWPRKVPLHPDFKKPDRQGRTRPKAKTEWFARFKAQVGYAWPVKEISDAFNIPRSADYTTKTGSGGCCIGSPFNECGYLWINHETGPYAMWIPDVPGFVKRMAADGCTVTDEEVLNWKPDIEGARAIEPEEWDILVAQHELAEKKRAKAEAVPA